MQKLFFKVSIFSRLITDRVRELIVVVTIKNYELNLKRIIINIYIYIFFIYFILQYNLLILTLVSRTSSKSDKLQFNANFTFIDIDMSHLVFLVEWNNNGH